MTNTSRVCPCAPKVGDIVSGCRVRAVHPTHPGDRVCASVWVESPFALGGMFSFPNHCRYDRKPPAQSDPEPTT